MCALAPESFVVPDTWDCAWEAWANVENTENEGKQKVKSKAGYFDKKNLSAQSAAKMLERSCRLISDRLVEEEKMTHDDASYSELLAATIVSIESHTTGDLDVSDLLYILSCWHELSENSLAGDVKSLLLLIADDYDSPQPTNPAAGGIDLIFCKT